jgi:general secretion pathway protein K
MSEKMAFRLPPVYKSNRADDETERDGFVIVAVLWMLAALSILATVYASYVISTATGVKNYDENLKAEALVSAGLELTAYRELSLPIRSRPTHGQFSFQMDNAVVAVDYRSEASRIDLNVAPKNLLAGLFMALGTRVEDADFYADRVIEWRSARHAQAGSGSIRNVDYPIRGGKFPNPAELVSVRDLPPELIRRALPFITVYSGIAKVDILDAAPQVIAALPGMNRQRLDAILAARQAETLDEQDLLRLLGPARDFATTEAGRTFRVTTYVHFHNGRRTNSQVVILLFNSGKEPFSVLSWRDSPYGLDIVQ